MRKVTTICDACGKEVDQIGPVCFRRIDDPIAPRSRHSLIDELMRVVGAVPVDMETEQPKAEGEAENQGCPKCKEVCPDCYNRIQDAALIQFERIQRNRKPETPLPKTD